MADALPLSENCFGKMRGRFDEAAARRVARDPHSTPEGDFQSGANAAVAFGLDDEIPF